MNKKLKLNTVEKKILSRSMIWEQMGKYYEDLGPDAWQKDLVPYQVTSNKLLAYVYTNLIAANLCEISKNQNYHKNNTYYILELGAGHGKFTFYMCKFIEHLNLYN